MSEDSTDRDPTDSKVGRVIAEYDLDGFGAELEARWTGERGERTSLRDLADVLNRRLLRQAMAEAGDPPLEPDVEATYQALTGDGVSRGVQTQVRRDLQRQGVDVDSLEADFVTHQAVHTYLTEYRGAEHVTGDDDPRDSARQTIQRLRSRTLAVVENSLDRLRKAGHLATGDLEVFVNVRVTCTDCGSQYDVVTLLSDGQCDCETVEEPE